MHISIPELIKFIVNAGVWTPSSQLEEGYADDIDKEIAVKFPHASRAHV